MALHVNPSDSCNDEMNVRSRNSIEFVNYEKFHKQPDYNKYVGERRDYGGSDNGFKQVILDDYSLFNLYADYGKFKFKICKHLTTALQVD